MLAQVSVWWVLLLLMRIVLVRDNRLYFVEFSIQLEVVVEQSVVEMLLMTRTMRVMIKDWIEMRMAVVVP